VGAYWRIEPKTSSKADQRAVWRTAPYGHPHHQITGDNVDAAALPRGGVSMIFWPKRPRAKLKLSPVSGRRTAGRHERRWTNDAPPWRRRTSAGGDEFGHAGGEGSRQYGRPRFESDQIDRNRRGRQQLLITRGSLTTFSIANDVAQVLCHHSGCVRDHVSQLAHRCDALGHPNSRYSPRLFSTHSSSCCSFHSHLKGSNIDARCRFPLGVIYWCTGLGGIVVPFCGIRRST